MGSMIWTLSPNIMVFFSFCLHDTEVIAYIMGFLSFYFHDVEVAVHIMGSLPFQLHGVHALTYIMEITHVLFPPPFDHSEVQDDAAHHLDIVGPFSKGPLRRLPAQRVGLRQDILLRLAAPQAPGKLFCLLRKILSPHRGSLRLKRVDGADRPRSHIQFFLLDKIDHISLPFHPAADLSCCSPQFLSSRRCGAARSLSAASLQPSPAR